jgi:phage terminase large subunit-like protein
MDLDSVHMLRKLFTAICIVEALAPEALITSAERVALNNSSDCEWRPWVTLGARLEGLVFLGMMWWSDASYSAFKKFLGLIGLLALLYPHSYVDHGTNLAYTAESKPEWKPWVYTGTRLVGLLYVIITLNELRRN